MPTDVSPYDALLLVSFGGPERPEDVVPFLANVTAGRGIPSGRLVEVAEHYFAFGGRSPISDQCRALIAAVEADFAGHGIAVPVYWGNRNWDPYLTDTVAKMQADGVRRAAAFVTSAYSSYSGCRQYRENLFDAVSAANDAPRIDRLRHYFNHPGFVRAFVDSTCHAIEALPRDLREGAQLVFVTHSLPTAMADTSGPTGGSYVEQHESVAALVATGVAERLGRDHDFVLTYCSRSGASQTTWLEPDVNDHLDSVKAAGREAVVLIPVGFVSDHMEVVYDLDTEAAATAERLDLAFVRAATPGVHPAFVALVRDLFVERARVETGVPVERVARGSLGPAWDVCQPHCCPNLRGERPALCQAPA